MADQTEEPLWQVEEILAKRGEKGKEEYRVKWLGYGPEHNSWEPTSSFVSTAMIEDFEAKLLAARRRTAPPTQVAAQARRSAAPAPATSPTTPLTPGSASIAPAATAASGQVDVVTRHYLAGREVIKILGMGKATIETEGGGEGQLLCYRCRFNDGTERYVPKSALKEVPEARLAIINFLEKHLNYE